MEDIGQQIKEQVEVISLLFVKLLVQFDLSLLVDSKGNFYFRKNDTNIEARVSKENFIEMYKRQLNIIDKVEKDIFKGFDTEGKDYKGLMGEE